MKRTELTGLLVFVLVLVAGTFVAYNYYDSSDVVESGDYVSVRFTVSFDNGTVVATTDTDKSVNASIYREKGYSFIVGEENDQYPLDSEVLGMRVGEKKVKAINPVPLPYTSVFPRYVNKTRIIRIAQNPHFPKELFKEYFGDTFINNHVFNKNYFPWGFNITNLDENGSVRLRANINPGESYLIPGLQWNSTITDITTGMVYLRQNPELGQLISAGWGVVKVINLTDDHIVLLRMPVVGSRLMTERGVMIITDFSDTEMFLRPARQLLEEVPFKLELEVDSIRKGVRTKKSQVSKAIKPAKNVEVSFPEESLPLLNISS